ncbi:MAG: nucleotide exchange factor GrpE [Bacillota bacterium]
MTTKDKLHEEELCEAGACQDKNCAQGQAEPAECTAQAKHDKKAKHKAKEHDEKLEKANAKAKENYDLFLRTAAEFDNFRKRTTKEKENVYSDSIAEMVAVMLPVLDNFERALSTEVGSEEAVGFKAGMEMIFKQMNETFQKLGVKEIETVTFDPNLHEAVMHVEDENFGVQAVVEVFQKGYVLKDKVIRHSMVKVAN